jgi:hypothetical protein
LNITGLELISSRALKCLSKGVIVYRGFLAFEIGGLDFLISFLYDLVHNFTCPL